MISKGSLLVDVCFIGHKALEPLQTHVVRCVLMRPLNNLRVFISFIDELKHLLKLLCLRLLD